MSANIAIPIVIEMANTAVDVWARKNNRTFSSEIQCKMWSFLATKPGNYEKGGRRCSLGDSLFAKNQPTTGGKKTLAKKLGPKVTRARKRKVDDFDFELRGHKMKKIKQYFNVESERAADKDQEMELPVAAADDGEMEPAQ